MTTKHFSDVETGYDGITFDDILHECLASSALAVDSQGHLLVATPEAERLLGWIDGLAQPPPGKLPAPIEIIVNEANKSAQLLSDRRVEIESTAGERKQLAVSVIPVSSRQTAGMAVLILRDLSAAARLENQIRRMDRLASIGALSAGMAHEIKNALVAVKTFIDLLVEKNQDAELAGIVRREMTRVDSIVGQMLRFSGPARPTLKAVSLHAILDHSLRLVQHRTTDRLISFNRKFGAAHDSFQADEHQLEQAFVNLLFNAVEAMGGEGALTVSTDLVDADNAELHDGAKGAKAIRVRISDTGGGIAPENLGRIFEPFFTTKHSGTGLGLAVTRRIIEEHGGSIEVESELRKGTTFIVCLPGSAGK